ncbi:hypothetical protein [Butyrivibrio sp. LB2008]|uniref:hypothetical protein n=1 Tax=Butyrivibrio sp. LB2008 TaxID=1408305 RepID=UPI00047D65E6|nr:hypothetical protein [Butyrivibrio sp. LB2008]
MTVFLYILLLVTEFIIRIVVVLIKRVDLTNSLVIGAIPVFLVREQGFDKKTNLIIFGIAVLLALIIQHMFTIAKILASVISCVAIAFLCAIWKSYDSRHAQLTVVVIGTIIAAIWNLQYWYGYEREL